jgi:hypothetical protein
MRATMEAGWRQSDARRMDGRTMNMNLASAPADAVSVALGSAARIHKTGNGMSAGGKP